MISSTPALAGAGSMVLGAQLLMWSLLMALELINWLAVGGDGETKISSSPRLITPCTSWVLCFPAH